MQFYGFGEKQNSQFFFILAGEHNSIVFPPKLWFYVLVEKCFLFYFTISRDSFLV